MKLPYNHASLPVALAPIVYTPQDVLNTFFSTKIDYLAIGNFLVSKEDSHRR